MLLAELGAQTPHVNVDRAGTAVVVVPPHPAEQGLSGEDLARMLTEMSPETRAYKGAHLYEDALKATIESSKG